MNPFDRRFVFVTGKGGVGKTSVSAALSHLLARQGRRVLLATTDPSRYAEIFPTTTFRTHPTPAGPGLSVVQLEPDAALSEYGKLLIKPRLARQALFENRYVQGFLRAIPGLRQWAVLGKAWYHTTEKQAGRARFDTVILDAPATGHGLSMLRVPHVIMDVAPAGLLRRDAEAAWKLFQSPSRSCFVIVTLPGILPVNESLELHAEIAGLGIPLGAIVANRVSAAIFSAPDAAALAALAVNDESVLQPAVHRAIRQRVQAAGLSRLESSNAPLYRLPELPADLDGQARVLQLAEALERAQRPMPR